MTTPRIRSEPAAPVGRTCGPTCAFDRPGAVSRREVTPWAFGLGCPPSAAAADLECHRVARAFVATAIRLGSAA